MAKFLDETGLSKVFSLIKANFEKKGKITISEAEESVTTKNLTIIDSNGTITTYKVVTTE